MCVLFNCIPISQLAVISGLGMGWGLLVCLGLGAILFILCVAMSQSEKAR